MYNWSTDTKKLAVDRDAYAIWQLEQMINFGLDGRKIQRKKVKKYWDRLTLDPQRRKFLDLLLHGK